MGRIYFLPSLILALVMWLAFTMELLMELTEIGTQNVLNIYVPIYKEKKKNLGCFWPDPRRKTYWKDLSSICSLKHNYILNHTSDNVEIHEENVHIFGHESFVFVCCIEKLTDTLWPLFQPI